MEKMGKSGMYFGRFMAAKVGFGFMFQLAAWLFFPLIAKLKFPTMQRDFVCSMQVFDNADYQNC